MRRTAVLEKFSVTSFQVEAQGRSSANPSETRLKRKVRAKKSSSPKARWPSSIFQSVAYMARSRATPASAQKIRGFRQRAAERTAAHPAKTPALRAHERRVT